VPLSVLTPTTYCLNPSYSAFAENPNVLTALVIEPHHSPSHPRVETIHTKPSQPPPQSRPRDLSHKPPWNSVHPDTEEMSMEQMGDQ
jgi:hypothetical protein